MITSFKATIANEEKNVLINKHENIVGVYQVHVDAKYKGDLYYRWGQWNIDNSDINHEDIQSLGDLAKTID